jgi:hypothetical protein
MNPGRLFLAIAIAHAPAPAALAATAYLGLEPGWARQADVLKVLGEPVFKVGDVLQEHKPQDGTGPIYIEYRLNEDVVDRIEVKLVGPAGRAAVIEAMKLPQQVAASKVGSGGSRVEYYGEGASITLGYAGADAGSGVVSIGYNSDRLFDAEVARATPAGGSGAGGSGGGTPPSDPGAGGGLATPPAPPTTGTPPPSPPPVTLTGTVPPSVKRNPAACYDLYVFADAQALAAQRARQVARRQSAMGIRIAAQSGDCDRARQLVEQYKKQYSQH